MSQAAADRSKTIQAFAPHLEIGRLLSNAGNIHVFEARQIDTNRRIMLRICPLPQCALGQSAAQVQRVAAKLRTLHHPGLATIYNGNMADNAVYLETEFVHGRNLSDFAGGHWLTDRQVFELAMKVCETFEYIHSQGIAYGDLIPNGVLIARNQGSLRVSAKLVRGEGMRAFQPDGRDQRAFAAFVTAILDRTSPKQQSSLINDLRTIAVKCGSTATAPPPFNAITRELRSFADRQRAETTSNAMHLAEPLLVDPPSPPKSRLFGIEGSRGNALWIVLFITIGVLSGVVTSMNDRPPARTSTLDPSWKTNVPPRLGSSQPRVNFLKPGDNSTGGASGPPTTGSMSRFSSMRNERTYHFTPSPSRMDHLPGPAFERLGLTPPVDESPREDITLSNPAWVADEFGKTVLSVECTAPISDMDNRLVWIIEADGQTRMRAHLFGDIREPKTLRGDFVSTPDNELRSPITTYLAVEPIGFGEPRRVSNILSVAEPE